MKEIWNVAVAGLHSGVDGTTVSDPHAIAHVKTGYRERAEYRVPVR